MRAIYYEIPLAALGILSIVCSIISAKMSESEDEKIFFGLAVPSSGMNLSLLILYLRKKYFKAEPLPFNRIVMYAIFIIFSLVIWLYSHIVFLLGRLPVRFTSMVPVLNSIVFGYGLIIFFIIPLFRTIFKEIKKTKTNYPEKSIHEEC